jgi:hypothetical protein
MRALHPAPRAARARARARGEQGTVVVMTALMVIGSLMMVGLVLDLGELRADRRTNKSVTDMAARAGVGRLAFGPWNGVCKARDYLIGNARGFSSFDAGSVTWSTAAAQLITTDPCPSLAFSEDPNPCVPNNPATWAKLQATAGGGRFTVEIQAGYALPDPRFAEDVGLGDPGAPELGGCDNLAVILTERQGPAFAQAGGGTVKNLRVRSVGRLNAEETLDFVAALQLLDRHNCDVLTTGGSGTKVIAQPYNTYPGTIQIDSDGGPLGDCTSNKRILVGQDTSGGGTIVACSTDGLVAHGCEPTTGSNSSRIGVYAANFKPAALITSNYSATGVTSYGDTPAKPSPRTGRKYVDQRYRQNLITLDQEVKGMLNGSNPYPPGCLTTSVPGGIGICVGLGVTWLVVEGCGSLVQSTLNLDLIQRAFQYIWFRCDLDVSVPLSLTGANSFIVVTGQLAVSSTFTITDPRKVFVGGRGTGNVIGMEIKSGALNMNTGGAAACSARTGAGYANRLVVGKGSFNAGSGATVRMCQTFIYLASGYDKVPATDGTFPCVSPCSGYSGTIAISSGAVSDLSAPNEITGRLPTAAELAATNPFEDLGLWTEAGGGTNGMAGGASTSLTGVFFLPNAAAFSLTGGGALPIRLSAQFVITRLAVTGNATINLVPNPEDSIPVRIYTTLLVR